MNRSWPASIVCLALASGCCDPAKETADRAGPNATACGYAALDEDRTPVRECLEAALAEARSAHGGWQIVGRDSELRRYFATGGERDFVLLFDGDPSGGGGADPVITVFPCDGRLYPVAGDAGFGCDSDAYIEPFTICD